MGGGWSEQSQKANIQSRGDNKRKTKDSSGWQDAPGAAMLLLCWRGLLSCGVGQLETGGLTGGGSRRNNSSLKRKGGVNLIIAANNGMEGKKQKTKQQMMVDL